MIPKRDVLVYLGLHKGEHFDYIYKNYRICYGFEANPTFYKALREKYKNYPHVQMVHAAVADHDGEILFNISDNDGASSSIGHFDSQWPNKIKMIQSIRVPCVNLLAFLRDADVSHVSDYISDIQGMDLTVLTTLKPLIDEKRIDRIQCETTKDEHRNIYADLPDNSETGFRKLLEENYDLCGKGWGVLREGKFVDVPRDWWEMDCMWKVKRK